MNRFWPAGVAPMPRDLPPTLNEALRRAAARRPDRLALAFYGADVMLLVGGALLSARERLAEEAARFSRRVAEHAHG